MYHFVFTVHITDLCTRVFRMSTHCGDAAFAQEWAIDNANALTRGFGFPVTYTFRKGRK